MAGAPSSELAQAMEAIGWREVEVNEYGAVVGVNLAGRRQVADDLSVDYSAAMRALCSLQDVGWSVFAGGHANGTWMVTIAKRDEPGVMYSAEAWTMPMATLRALVRMRAAREPGHVS